MIKRIIKIVFAAILISFSLFLASKIIVVYNAIKDDIASSKGYDININSDTVNKSADEQANDKNSSSLSYYSNKQQNSGSAKSTRDAFANSGDKSSAQSKSDDSYDTDDYKKNGSNKNENASISNQLSSISDIPIDAYKAESKVKSIAGDDVDVKDLFTVGFIVLNKLSTDEIKFLFNSAKDDYFLNTPVEEIEKTREILFSKLSDEELETLRSIGKKYGYSMRLLEKDLNVAKAKEEVMKRYGRQ